MVASSAKSCNLYYVAVALRNGQYLAFVEGQPSIMDAMDSVKEELYKESWDGIMVVDGRTRDELFEGNVLARPLCLSELRKEYPAVFSNTSEGFTSRVAQVPDLPIVTGATSYSGSPVVKFHLSFLADK